MVTQTLGVIGDDSKVIFLAFDVPRHETKNSYENDSSRHEADERQRAASVGYISYCFQHPVGVCRGSSRIGTWI